MTQPYTPNGPAEPTISRVDFDAVTALVARLERRVTELEAQPPEPATKTADFLARPGQTVVLEPPGAGIKCSIVKATKFNRGETIQFIQRNANKVSIRAIDGTVNGQTFVTSNAVGTFFAVSDGQTGWLLDQGIGPAGVSGAPGTPAAVLVTPPGIGASAAFALMGSRPIIPGAAGAAGATGLSGPPGRPGTDGRSGQPGPTGAAGVDGATGATGPSGTGAPVPPGLSLSQIYATLPGSTAPGAPGAAGATGPTGPAGPAGSGSGGNTPPPGLGMSQIYASLPNPLIPGPPGTAGAAGAIGATGATGPTGAQGSNVPPGLSLSAIQAFGRSPLPMTAGWATCLGAGNRSGANSPIIESGQSLVLTAPSVALGGVITSTQNLTLASDVQIFNSSPSFAWSITSGTENFRFRGASGGCGIQLQRCTAPVSAPEVNTALLWFKTESNAERTMSRTLNSTGVTLTDWPLDCTAQVGRTTVASVGGAAGSTALLDLCGTYTIEANILIVGSVWRAVGVFNFARGATATGMNALVNFRIGGASITTTLTGLLITSGTNSVFRCQAEFTVLATGVGSCSAMLTAFGATNVGAGNLNSGTFNSALAVTTTGTVAVSMDVQMSAVVTNTTLTALGGYIERVR